ncbi:MAG: phage holin family protein [Bacteroidales bacterium]|nr:phage holin family protein [Bacteroidales bacterium]MCK4361242.1 phage holin family protein [Bacteroidales bacterium]MCK4406287.1 phage holin family protein [Bacteroidales bacterium]
MDFIIKLLITAVVVMFTAWILPGIQIKNYWSAIIVAIILALLNIFVKPVMVFLTIPLTIITFGLFLFVINALIILLAGAIVSGFKVMGFWWALAFSIIISLISYILGTNNVPVIF